MSWLADISEHGISLSNFDGIKGEKGYGNNDKKKGY